MSTIAQTVQLDLATSAWANGGTPVSPVTPSAAATPALVNQAAQMSALASAVVQLGGGSSSSDLSTYTAAGLLDSFAQAGTLQGSLLSAATPAAAETTAQQNADQSVVTAVLGGTPASAGSPADNGSAILSQTLGVSPSTLNSAWRSVLANNPALAGEAAQNLTSGSIVNTLV